MRHNKAGRRLGRNSSHRSAMMRNMVSSLIAHEKITTTDARAKELRKIAERLITLGKRGDLHARRQAQQVLRDRALVGKLFDMVAPRYKDRPGGYTRILKLGNRLGDNASLSIIELVEEEFTPRPKKKAAAPQTRMEESKAAAPVEAPVEAADEPQAQASPQEISPAAEAAPAGEEKKED